MQSGAVVCVIFINKYYVTYFNKKFLCFYGGGLDAVAILALFLAMYRSFADIKAWLSVLLAEAILLLSSLSISCCSTVVLKSL